MSVLSATSLQRQHFPEDLAHALHCPDDADKAERITRAILHTLRDCLDLNKAICLLRLVPKSLKAIYIQHWSECASDMAGTSLSLFLQTVRAHAGKLAYYDFPTEALTTHYTASILSYIEKDMPEIKRRMVRATLPLPLVQLMEPLSQESSFINIYKGDTSHFTISLSKTL